MSSETSADESDTDSETNSYKVRDIPWLRKRYKQAFHALDRFYTNNKMSNRSKKMTHSRVRSKHPSERCMPGTVPTWAVREAYRSDENSADSSVLNTSGSSETVDSS